MDLIFRKLKSAREILGLKQSEAATKIGVNQNDISRLENGKREFIPNSYISFLDSAGINISSLFNDDISIWDFTASNERAVHLLRHNTEIPDFPIGYSDIVTEIVKKDEKPPKEVKTTEEKEENINIPRLENEDVDLNSRPFSRPISKNKRKGLHEGGLLLDDDLNSHQSASINRITTNLDWLSRLIDVPIIDISAAGSSESGFFAQDFPETVMHIQLPDIMLKRGKKHIGITVINDSMYPTLQVNDTLIVSESDVYSIRDGYIYVIVSKERGIVVKRLKNRIRELGFITCRSDNRLYKSFDIAESDIVSLFEVVCKLSHNLSNETDSVMEIIGKLEDRINNLEAKISKQ